jgi:type IV pilus assembly protein PilB
VGAPCKKLLMINLLPLLEKKGILDKKSSEEIFNEAQETGRTVEEVLQMRGISEDDILLVKGEHWDIPVRSLRNVTIPYDIIKYIPEESAKHYQVVPLALVDNVLEIGIVDPDNIDALDALNFISTKQGVPFKAFLINERDYKKCIELYGGITSEVGRALTELTTEEENADSDERAELGDEQETQNLDDLEQTVQEAGKRGQSTDLHEEAPVTKIVATILRSAIDARASDIHIEPEYDQTKVRFRIDGILNKSLVLPAKVQRAVIARVKILAGIKLDERRKPQDGRFSATIGGRRVDFRVSTFPTYYGEKAVLRILDSERSSITLEDLGMNEQQFNTAKKAAAAPYGMILITGPTGSGKSTTLYAMLNEVDRDGKNVLSLEDPVEYNIKGVSQSQMRPEIGYTFATGIRSVLRQDPDIIMVGEIRDKETAQLAVQAALTGHLVLSTLHTNNAAGAVPRLVDMGVDPYLLAPTLNLVIAQRLVRRICPDSGKKVPITGPIKKMLEDQFSDLPEKYRKQIPTATEFLSIEPTGNCPAGTRGRVGVYEMLELTEEVRQAILEGADESIVYKIVRQNGMFSLKEDTIIKAMKKIVPFEEIAQIGGLLNLDVEGTDTDPITPTLSENNLESSFESGVASDELDLV